MSKPITQSYIYSLLNIFDWMGHVELGDVDKLWLSGELAAALSGGETTACEVCGFTKPIVISTSLGNICEDCIDNMSDEVEEIRESLEAGDNDADSDTQWPTANRNRST